MTTKKPIRSKSSSVADPVTEYAQSVVDGVRVAGPHVRNACKRHLRDLAAAPASGLTFDLARANEAIAFFEHDPAGQGPMADRRDHVLAYPEGGDCRLVREGRFWNEEAIVGLFECLLEPHLSQRERFMSRKTGMHNPFYVLCVDHRDILVVLGLVVRLVEVSSRLLYCVYKQ